VLGPDVETITWIVDGEAHECEVLAGHCNYCLARAVVALPPPVLAEQPDDTTHVCHPAFGGCNQGWTTYTLPSLESRFTAVH
jgi:hypothetical protein